MKVETTNPNDRLVRLDSNSISCEPREIHAFACIRNENTRLPYLLQYHRDLGVDRFFFIDNGSTDGSLEFLLAQADCHIFGCSGSFFASNVDPPVWSNAVRNTFCDGHWCLSLDADELFVFPRCEKVSLRHFCDYLDLVGKNAVQALVIDMYGQGPIGATPYQRGRDFIEAFPYFDRDKGEELPLDGGCPPVLTFSRFRERAFWTGPHKRKRPPCITQVPLVKWQNGTGYRVAQHILNHGKLSDIHGAVLHFKFFPGFLEGVKSSLDENSDVSEKGLDERQAYIDALKNDPTLSLFNNDSVKYTDSRMLVEMGWMRTTKDYERYTDTAPRRTRTY